MSVESLATWRSTLADMGALGDALASAVDRDDVVAAISANIELRRTRSVLSRTEPPAAPGDPGIVAELAALVLGARRAEAIVQSWRSRAVPGDALLLRSALGTALLADAMLPEVWDFDADLVVLVGGGLEGVAGLLVDIGQRRIVALDATSTRGGVLSATTADEVVAAVRTMIPNPPRQVVLRGAFGVPAEELATLSDRIREALSDLRIHRNTVRAFSRTWIAQGTSNMPAVARWPSVATVGDALAGMPIVIVAPGPSLAQNIDQLRALRGRALLMAFSHSLKPVLAAGLTPDLILTVDPQDVRYHFAGCDTSKSYLVTAATAHPSLLELPARGHILLSANSAIDDWIFDAVAEDAVAPGGGSVATTALSLALRWRCDPIIYVGLDLSFPGGQYYVSSSSDGQARAEVTDGLMRVVGWSGDFHRMKAGGGPQAPRERVVELPGWHGGTVPSSFMFSMFHRWFVERLAGGVASRVYNCTEGGAFIPGMQHVRLHEVLAGLTEERDIGAVLASISVDAPARTSAFSTHLTHTLARMRRCRRLVQTGRAMIRGGERGASLARVERAIVKLLKPLSFLSLTAQREVDAAWDVAVRRAEAEAYVDAQDCLFAALVSVIDEVAPQLERALGRLSPVDGGTA